MPKVIFRHNAVTIGNKSMTDRKPPKPKSTRRPASSAKAPRLGRDIQVRIGDRLRAMYDDVVEQGVPDRFTALLQRFDDQHADDADDQNTNNDK